jgi:hypothetical protein
MDFKDIKKTLLEEWDPLNVGDNPNLADEYDSYLPGLLKFLKAGRSSREIADYLQGIEDRLGVTPPPEPRNNASISLAAK